MHQPLVTVVIPSFSRPRQLYACLSALAAQTFPEPWEVVVVDDGSPIPLTDLAAAFAGGHPICVIRQDNAGPAEARNRGAREARGELIAFTDDDCLPAPEWLETLMQSAREHPGALIGGTTINGLSSQLFASTSQLIVDFVYDHYNADLDNAYFFASNNLICSKEHFLALGGFDRGFPRPGAEDRDFCDRWRLAGLPMIWRPAARVEHRHAQSIISFIRLHVRYGRGAFLYQSKRRLRGSGKIEEDLSFHCTLPHRIYRHLRIGNDRILFKVSIVASLVLWQLANAFGFAIEGISEMVGQLCSRLV